MKTGIALFAAAICIALPGLSRAASTPEELMARGQAAVIEAMAAGAITHAPAELGRARLTLKRARVALLQSDGDGAMRLAEQAASLAAVAEKMARNYPAAAVNRTVTFAAAKTSIEN